MSIFETNLHNWLMPSTVQRLGYEGTKAMLPDAFWLEGHALWEMTAKDEYGNITKHGIGSNLITDAGATMFLRTMYGTGTTVAPFQYAALEQGTASTTTTTTLSTSSPITSVAVGTLVAGSSIAINQPIMLISGTSSQTIYATAAASAGATSVSVASAVGGSNFTPNFAYPSGSLFIPQPMFSDNPTSIVGGVYVAIPSGSFAYNNNQAVSSVGFTGNGARQVAFNNITFTGTSGNQGQYTGVYLCSANPVTASNQTANHYTFGQSYLSNGGTLVYNFTERL